MTETLLAVGYVAGAIVVGCLAVGAAAALVLRWRLASYNRVSPGAKGRAPLWWLCSPAASARLHRRLRAAVRLANVRPVPSSADSPALSVQSLRRELEATAVELDDQLVVAAHHPAAHRRRLLRALQTQVEAVEALAVRLSGMSQPIGGPAADAIAPSPRQRGLEELTEQVDALEAAHGELRQIDAAHRLSAAPAPRGTSEGTTTS
jgi:hypothetical protein